LRYYDENGQAKGIDIEIIDLVMNEMKLPYKFNLINSTERGVIEAKSGNVNMLMSKIMKEDRKSFLIYPQETYRNIAWNFFIRKEDEGKIKYDSINNLKVGATKSFAYTAEFWAAGLNLEIVTNNSLQINKLIYKRFDIVPMTTLSTLYDARNNKQLDKITYFPKVLVFTKLYNVFTKTSIFPDKEKLIKEYDRVIREKIKNGSIKAIFDKYNYTERPLHDVTSATKTRRFKRRSI
tara:strand:+ start:3319 stop:4026 length:708 start_codon:yes stop_codon:yes gene_type:complete